MNEKIEDRNEDLHRFRQKIVTTVIIISHYREKLQFLEEQNEIE